MGSHCSSITSTDVVVIEEKEEKEVKGKENWRKGENSGSSVCTVLQAGGQSDFIKTLSSITTSHSCFSVCPQCLLKLSDLTPPPEVI